LGTGVLFFRPTQPKPPGTYISIVSHRICLRLSASWIMVLAPFVGRVGLDIGQPELVGLSVVADARRPTPRDLNEAQRH
jgi:hypothetical protein